jgi:hypothetical protein
VTQCRCGTEGIEALVGAFGRVQGPALVGVGILLGILAAMLPSAMIFQPGWITLVIRVIGLVVFSVGAVVLTRRGMRGTDRSSSFQFGLGIGCIVGALLYWMIVPLDVATLLSR